MFTHQTFKLDRGAHEFRHEGVCFMEAVAFINGDGHTSRPECTDGPLAEIMMGINDGLGDRDRQRLVPFIPRAITPPNRAPALWADRRARHRILVEALLKIDMQHDRILGGQIWRLIYELTNPWRQRTSSGIQAGRTIALHLPLDEVLEVVDRLLPPAQIEIDPVDPEFDPAEPPEPEPDPDEVEIPEKPELVPA